MNEDTIEKAREMLHPINYETFDYGYFVKENGNDMGNSDYCIKCIPRAVKEARKFHKEQRGKILAKFKEIEETGFFNGVNVKEKYTETQIKKAKRQELKEFPAKASFTYEGHDPDFGGGLSEPCQCEQCGEYFTCNFEPNKEEAEHLLFLINYPEPLSEKDKWEIDLALQNYEYVNDEVKLILDQVVELLVNSEKD